MVLGFAKDNLHFSESELLRLASDIREGDMSVLLKEYEKEIKVIIAYLVSIVSDIYISFIMVESFKERYCW